MTFNYDTTNGTAQAGADYTANTGTVILPVGQNTVPIVIEIIGDLIVEADEIFDIIVNLSQGAASDEVIANGRIINDDAARISIAALNSPIIEPVASR